MSKPPADTDLEPYEGDDKTKISPIKTIDPVEVESTPSLLMISGTQLGRSFPITSNEFMIGRAGHSDLAIEDDLVSRHHCKIVLHNDGRTEILDLASTNGTLLNGRKVERSEIKEGDQIQVGSLTILKYHLQEEIEAKFLTQLYDAATRDFLTNTYNKRFFIDRLQDEFAFADRHEGDLSILVIDIDHFKRVNDTYGHLSGDIAIKKVAHHLVSHTRKDDIVARFGGEEFVVLMRDVDHIKAKHLGEALREGIEKMDIQNEGFKFNVTVSIGVACLSNNSKPRFHSFDHFIDHADKQLYSAKNSGRNKVCG